MSAVARPATGEFHRLTTALLAAAALALTLGARPAQADGSAALVLRGQIPVRCDIEVGATAQAAALDLRRAHRDLLVASVTETCNSPSGYTVSVSSRENGRLASQGAALSYQLRYDGATPDLSASAGAPVAVARSNQKTTSEGVQRSVRISLPGAPAGAEGIYEDTLTFTIAAK